MSKVSTAVVSCDVPNCPTQPAAVPLDFSAGFQGAPNSPAGWSVTVIAGEHFDVCPLHTPAVPPPAPLAAPT